MITELELLQTFRVKMLDEYITYVVEHKLSADSADELHYDLLCKYQEGGESDAQLRAHLSFLSDYIARWEAMDKIEDAVREVQS